MTCLDFWEQDNEGLEKNMYFDCGRDNVMKYIQDILFLYSIDRLGTRRIILVGFGKIPGIMKHTCNLH